MPTNTDLCQVQKKKKKITKGCEEVNLRVTSRNRVKTALRKYSRQERHHAEIT